MEKKKRIAVIFASSIYNQKGLFNAVHNRIKYLKKNADYDIDTYLLSNYQGRLITRIAHRRYQERPEEYSKEDITYHVLWRKNSVVDFVLYHKLHTTELFHNLYDKRTASLFKNYDLLDVHSGAGNLALQIKRQYGIPFIITWHGSDIHTSPFNGLKQKKLTRILLEEAACNCFVSKGLVDIAKTISDNFVFKILYNGANELFYKYSDAERHELRSKYGIVDKKVVAFIGNIMEIKNPLSLPIIFKQVKKEYNGELQFWIIGDGDLKPALEKGLHENSLDYVLWGNQPADKIPDFLNAIDVVILPSLKEGFGMVLVEALKCGANAVASRVGGTIEILGSDDTFVLDNTFSERISSRIVYYLNNKVKQNISDKFSWEVTASLENNIICSFLK